MSDRERWIVYPLLFMSLLMGLRSQQVSPEEIRCEKVTCRELNVRGATDQLAAMVRGDRSGGAELMLFSPGRLLAARLSADGKGDGGKLELLNGHGDVAGRMGSQDGGGYLRLVGEDDVAALVLEHHRQRAQSGLVAEDADGALVRAAKSDQPDAPWGIVLPWPTHQEPALRNQ